MYPLFPRHSASELWVLFALCNSNSASRWPHVHLCTKEYTLSDVTVLQSYSRSHYKTVTILVYKFYAFSVTVHPLTTKIPCHIEQFSPYLWNLASHISVKPNLRSQTSLFLSINSLLNHDFLIFLLSEQFGLNFYNFCCLTEGKSWQTYEKCKVLPCTFILSEATLFKNISDLLMIKWPFLLESAFEATLRPGIHCCGFITVTELFLFFLVGILTKHSLCFKETLNNATMVLEV